ncbi:MAG: VIT domain-containing protein [Myxococcales bacterium]|nr:VIT domain-containing protein [Myxococcales bacterium]
MPRSIHASAVAWVMGVGSSAVAGCGGDVAMDSTVAVVEAVAGHVGVGQSAPVPLRRVAASEHVATDPAGRAMVVLDGGPRVLCDARTRLELLDADAVRLHAGRIFAEVREGDDLRVDVSGASLRLGAARASIELGEQGTDVHLLAGEASWSAGASGGALRAGETLRLSDNAPRIEPTRLWDDWTGGLARAGTDESGPRGVGVLEARVPDEVGMGRWPLVVRRLHVRVRIEGDLAITDVEQEFFNPASEAVEGIYRIRVPQDALVQRFAVDRRGRLVDGYVREREQASRAYDAQVYRGSTDDPALLEWDGPEAYRARIYPIAAGQTRRIAVRYAQWLWRAGTGAPRLYRFPMGAGDRAPLVQELSIEVDATRAGASRLRAGMGAAVENGRVTLRRSDVRARADFWVELDDEEPPRAGHVRAWRAPHRSPEHAAGRPAPSTPHDEADYWLLPVTIPVEALGPRPVGIDLVVVADVSAATDRAHLELGRSVVEAIVAQLGPADRVAVVGGDVALRPVAEPRPTLGEASSERRERLLDALARLPGGGATDLGAVLTAASELLDPSRPGAVLYVGDGRPTVGEMDAGTLLERLERAPHPIRLYAVGVGPSADLALLEALTRGGGLALRVEDRAQAAESALRLLAHARRPVVHRVRVDLGSGLESVYPRRPVDLVAGDALHVVGRVRGAVPSRVTLRGVVMGRAVEHTVEVVTSQSPDATDLRLRWGAERLRQLVLENAGREAIAELGVRLGLVTPFTTLYVPSEREAAASGLPWSSLRPGWPSVAWLGIASLWHVTGCEKKHERAQSSAPLLESRPRTQPAPSLRAPADPPGSASSEAIAASPSASAAGALDDTATRAGAASPSMPADRESLPATGAPPAPVAPRAGTGRMEAEPAERHAGSETLVDQGGTSAAIGATAGYGDRATPTASVGDAFEAPVQRMRAARSETERDVGDTEQLARAFAPISGSASAGGEPSPSIAARPEAARGASRDVEIEGSAMPALLTRAVRARRDELLACAPGKSGHARIEVQIAPGGNVTRAKVLHSTLRDAAAEICLVSVTSRSSWPADASGSAVTVRFTVHFGTASLVHLGHELARCSDASRVPLDERRQLWRERLATAGGPARWVELLHRAAAECELPGWRDRRALLDLVLERAGSIDAMLRFHGMMSDAASRLYLQGAILRRVRTAEDLARVRLAFGLSGGVDWALVERLLQRAEGPDARLRVLRGLVAEMPWSFDLRLRLLEELERAGRAAEALRLADALRRDPLADAGVRTAVGELLLRRGDEEAARRVFSEIVEMAPDDELARRRLGDLYRAHGWYEDAYRQYETLARIRPDDPTVLLLLAQAAAGAGRIDEALRLEQRVAETAPPGGAEGLARIALLVSAIRYAKLRAEARAAGDARRLEAVTARMRRSGVPGIAVGLRVALLWAHPDAHLSLWAAHPRMRAGRPTDVAAELGIEAFDVLEPENEPYRIEVRRAGAAPIGTVRAELVVIWNEGKPDERIEIVPVELGANRTRLAWNVRQGRLEALPDPAGEPEVAR